MELPKNRIVNIALPQRQINLCVIRIECHMYKLWILEETDEEERGKKGKG